MCVQWGWEEALRNSLVLLAYSQYRLVVKSVVMLREEALALEEGEEDLESQLDRLNEVLTRTIHSAQQTLNTDPEQEDIPLPLESPTESHPESSLEESGSFDLELQEYIEALMLELERRQMKLEDGDSQAVEWGGRGVVFLT